MGKPLKIFRDPHAKVNQKKMGEAEMFNWGGRQWIEQQGERKIMVEAVRKCVNGEDNRGGKCVLAFLLRQLHQLKNDEGHRGSRNAPERTVEGSKLVN